tara:strand:- start:704 stop:862 length:159 start_codon:yes stop_codon:yes gene_type:complete
MEDKRQWESCHYCGGEFAVESDCAMDILYCVFCGEPLDKMESEDPIDFYEET